MRILLCFVFIILLANVYSLLYMSGNDQDRQNEYPHNVDVPSIIHKYEFDDPNAIPNHYTDIKDDIDYATFEENENPRNYGRGFSDWLFQSDAVDSADICNTQDCQKVADDIRNNIDFSVNPCDDFDKFACGGWRINNPIPKTNSKWTIFSQLWQNEEKILRNEIEHQANSSVNSSGSLVYNWYSACMDEKEILRLGASPFLYLIRKLGSCPLISRFWIPYGWSLIDQLVLLNRLAIHPFFLVTPGGDLLNSSLVLLQVSPSDLLLRSNSFYVLSGDYYTGIRRAYLKMMIELMYKLSPSRRFNERYFMQQIKQIYQLELLLAKAQLSNKYSTYQIMTLKELQWRIPEFPWRTYIENLYRHIPQKKPITGDELIGVHDELPLKRIAIILRLMPKSTLANYLIWITTYKFTDSLTPDFEAIHQTFVVAMYGEQKMKERWRKCVSSTSYALSMVVGRLFILKRFNEDSKRKAAEIIETIRQQLLKDFESISWMDAETTRNAKEKAKAIVKNIGYPKFVLNETELKMYYNGMSFNHKTYLFNILRRRIVLSRNTLYSREIEPNRGRWSMSPQRINAYYSSHYNKIVILAGVLQFPLWEAGYPMSMQYGGIGYIVGHEISHGFDDNGMNFDKHGNYHVWFSNSSLTAFKSKSRCLEDQYSHYKIFGQNINGKLTLGENIADNGGIKLAFNAYQQWLKTNGPDKTLPGLVFSNNQLFFLKAAQIWCSNIRKKSTLNSIVTDVHTPNMYRIIGTFSNFIEFSKAFNCPANSKMNPSKKCSVW